MNLQSSRSFAAPFGVRNFRYQWPADLATSWAFEMEILVLGWYMLAETGSVFLLTVFASIVFVGTLLAPIFGVAGDRFGHRNVMCAMRAFYTVIGLALMATIFTGMVSPLVVIILTFVAGLVRSSDLAMRSALVAETMPPALLAGAVGISRTTMDSARVVGALSGASLFASLGLGITFTVICSLYLLGFLLTLAISPGSDDTSKPLAAAHNTPAPQAESIWRELGAGLSYVWGNGHLQAAMWIAFLVNFTAFPLTSGLMPYVAKEIYGTDQTGLGYLLASFASGALIGSIIVSGFGRFIQPARMMIVFAAVWYLLLLAFAQVSAQNFGQTVGMTLLFCIGFAQSCSLVPLVILLMRTTQQRFRGRVMGVRMLAIYSLPIGLLIAGALIQHFDFRTTAMIYASAGLFFTAVIALRWRKALWPANAISNAQ